MADAIPKSSGAHRVSSIAASRAELDSGPTVVVPPASYMASTIPETIAMARARADEAIIDDDTSSDDDSNAAVSDIVPNYAFAFDIDGVLLKGGHVIPEAIEAMKWLNGENPDGIKVPYIFVTNVSFFKTKAEVGGVADRGLSYRAAEKPNRNGAWTSAGS